MEETPRSTESTAAFTMPQDGDTPNTSGDPEEVSTFGEVSSPSYGPAPMITSRPSFSPSTSSSVHPFKLERFVDNKGNPRTRVYLGRLRYCINTFDVIIENDMTGATTYGSLGSTNTGSGTAHTHGATGLSATVGDHYHASGGNGVGSAQQLKFKQHTHSLPNTTGDPTSGGSYSGGDHTHDLGGNTGNVTDFGTSPPSVEEITGNTGGIASSPPSSNVSGTLADESSHTHPLPDLSTATSEADRFVCILGQPQGAGIISEVEPAGFTALKDSNDKDTVVKAKDLPVGDTYGSIFLKWKVILSDSDSLGAYSINAADVTIHRHSDPAKTAEQLIIDNTEKLTHLRGVDDENNPASGTDMDFFKRGSESEDDRTAYYYIKIGVSYDPNAAGTNAKTIEQMTYENVYWSPLFLSRYTGAIS
jgi:hypothetical protein